MKKTLMILIICAVFLGGYTGTAFAAGLSNFQPVATYNQNQFSDVSADAWYASNVEKAYTYGLIVGNENALFNPNGELTLAEAIKLAANINSIYYTGTAITATNTTTGNWYQAYVDYALKNGIIDQTFNNYNKKATRLEFAEIFANALPTEALAAINDVDEGAIPDVTSNTDGADAVYILYRAGIMTGSDSNGTFNPNSNITRSEAMAIVTRMCDTTLRQSMMPTANVTQDLQVVKAKQTAVDRPTATSDQITVMVGDTTTLTITAHDPMFDGIVYNFVDSTGNCVKCGWGEWDDTGYSLPLYIQGLAPGTTKLVIYEDDKYGNKLGESLTINITVTDKAVVSNQYYNNYYPATDFGNYFGIALAATAKSDDNAMDYYYYNVKAFKALGIDKVLNTYGAELNKQGFVFNKSFTDSNGYPVKVFYNAQYKFYVLVGMDVYNNNAYLVVATTGINE